MTYISGNTILASDYNTIAWGSSLGNTFVDTPANAAVLFGTGVGRYGLGGSTTGIPAVVPYNINNPSDPNSTVAATQWSNLITMVNNMRNYQIAGYSSIAPVVAGNPVAVIPQLSTQITNAAAAMGTCALSTVDSTATNLTWSSGTWGASGNRRLTFTQNLTFASGDAARYFFNAGGKVKISFSRSGGTSNSRNTTWTNLLNACGTVVFGYMNTTKSAGSDTPTTIRNIDNGGYWNMTLTDVIHFKQYSPTAPYNIDFVEVNAKWSGTASNGGYPTLTFTIHLENDYVGSFSQIADGNVTSSFVLSSPPTAHSNNYLGSTTWGVPAFPSGTVVDN